MELADPRSSDVPLGPRFATIGPVVMRADSAACGLRIRCSFASSG